MKFKELREKSRDELVRMEGELTHDLWKTRLKNFTNQLDDTAKIGKLRRDIARVKTLLTELGRTGESEGKA